MAKDIEATIRHLSGSPQLSGRDLFNTLPQIAVDLGITSDVEKNDAMFDQARGAFTRLAINTGGILNPDALVYVLHDLVRDDDKLGAYILPSLLAAETGRPVAGCILVKEFDANKITVNQNTVKDWLLATFSHKIDADENQLRQTAALIAAIWEKGPKDLRLTSWHDPANSENPLLNQVKVFWQPVPKVKAQLSFGKELRGYSELDIRDFPFQSMDLSLRDWVYRLPFAGPAARINPDWVKGEWSSFPENSLIYQVCLPLGGSRLVFHEQIEAADLDTDLRIGRGFTLSHQAIVVEKN